MEKISNPLLETKNENEKNHHFSFPLFNGFRNGGFSSFEKVQTIFYISFASLANSLSTKGVADKGQLGFELS